MIDQEEILLERIRDKEHTEIYTRMLKLCEDDIERLKKEIAAITDYSATIKKRKAEMKESVDLIEQIIQEGAISDANQRRQLTVAGGQHCYLGEKQKTPHQNQPQRQV